jgi:hypothetical protein
LATSGAAAPALLEALEQRARHGLVQPIPSTTSTTTNSSEGLVSSVLGLRHPNADSSTGADGPEALLSDLQELLFMVRHGMYDHFQVLISNSMVILPRLHAELQASHACCHVPHASDQTPAVFFVLQFKAGSRSVATLQEDATTSADEVQHAGTGLSSAALGASSSHPWNAAIAQEQQLAAAWLASWAEAHPANCSKLMVRSCLGIST